MILRMKLRTIVKKEARAEAWAKEWDKKGDPRAVALEETKQLLEELKKRHNRK